MIDLTKRVLPNVVYVKGAPFVINTNFRVWIRFMNELTHLKPGQTINDVSYLFKDDAPPSCDIEELLEFANPKNVVPRSISRNDVRVLDYEIDGDLIYAAFLGQYGIDLTTIEDLHWHKFLALLKGLNDSTKLREIMGYRCYTKNTNKAEDQYERLRYAWQIEDDEDNSDTSTFNDLFTRKE